MQTVALAESTEWPDMKQAEYLRDQKAALALRKETDWVEACKRLGLTRQLKLAIAKKNYDEVVDFTPLVRNVVGAGDKFFWTRLGTSYWRSFAQYARAQACLADVNCFNKQIPYGILLAMEEARELGCFDSFAILAPMRDFCQAGTHSRDPYLLGVVDNTDDTLDPGFFIIARWNK